MSPEEQAELRKWQADIDHRTQGRQHGIKRGLRSQKRTSPDAWRCEGRWQADEQMDIWACIDEVELAERGDQDDDE